MKIQGDIADMLGITNFLPANSEIARASFLWERIKEKKRILIILDDVWERIKLDEIGIPFGSDHRGCKILITSRSKTICIQMECQKIHTVEILSKQESWVLFSEIVGLNVKTSDINSIAREIATKCGGLPIAIVTIAGALKGKNKHVWSNAARQLQKYNLSNIPGVKGILFSSLELSLHYLEKVESKSLFLFCSLFLKDYKIPIEVLVRYAIGRRWFNDVDETIEDVKDRVHAIVSTITSSFLLIDDGEEYVKMYDVVRDLALNIAPKYNHQFMVKAGIGLREWTNRNTYKDVTYTQEICVSHKPTFQNYMTGLKSCQNLQTFKAYDCGSLVYIFDYKDIKIAEGEAKLLSSLEYLNLEWLPKLSHIWKGDHQSISLRNLKDVELKSCNKLTKIFSPTLLQSLICLEKINIVYCHNLEEIFEKKEALDEELERTITSPSLGNLTSMDISWCLELKNLFSLSIVKCLVKLKYLHLWSCSRLQEIVTNEKGEKEASIERIMFPSLYNLILRSLDNLTCFSSGSYTIEFPALERLLLYGCRKMKTFGYGEQGTPKLNKVYVRYFGEGERWNDNLNATMQEFYREQSLPFTVETRRCSLHRQWLASSSAGIPLIITADLRHNPSLSFFLELHSAQSISISELHTLFFTLLESQDSALHSCPLALFTTELHLPDGQRMAAHLHQQVTVTATVFKSQSFDRSHYLSHEERRPTHTEGGNVYKV
ncbi:disease resistance protein RPS5-like [Pistacia vera]|uniref:disease resistance protein RPS5-like n=1 Tax=Pistacia vera TaxID=55513 RepID=UPI001262F37E|nr:disease resistance protein RPS5-like [Pistacia vera]